MLKPSFVRGLTLSIMFLSLAGTSVAYAQDAVISNSPSGNPATISNSPATTQTGGTQSSGCGAGTTCLTNPLKNITDLPSLLEAVLTAVLQLGTIVLVLMFVWVGFMFLRAQGKPEELKKARSALLWTFIGGAILLGAKEIANVIQSTVNGL